MEWILNHWIWLLLILYYVTGIALFIKILLERRNPAKTIGYFLAIMFLPVVGLAIYYMVGFNYRKQKLYKKKINC